MSSNPGRYGPTETYIRYNDNAYSVINLKVKAFIFDMTGEYTCDEEETVWTLDSAMDFFKVETEAELIGAAEGHKETGCPSFTIKNARVEEIELTDATEVSDGEIWDIKLYKERAYGVELFDTPWEETTEPTYFGNAYLADCYRGVIYSKDFAYFTCDGCGREICEQNPRNGWHVQRRIINECEVICLKCLQEMLLADGVKPEEVGKPTKKLPALAESGEVIVNGTVYVPRNDYKGQVMFFDHSELRKAGYEPGEHFFIRGESSMQLMNLYILGCYELGYERAVVGIDSSGMGLEYHVTVWRKPGPEMPVREKAAITA